MRRGTARKLEGKLTWGQYSGAMDERAGVPAYRTIEGREYKPIKEEVAVSRIERAAERRLAKREKRRKTFNTELSNGEVETPQEPELPQAQSYQATEGGPVEVRFDFE